MKNLLTQIIDFRWNLLIVISISFAVYIAFLVIIRNIDHSGKGLGISTIFVGLSGRSLVHLSVFWIKFVYYISILIVAKPAFFSEYLLYAILVCLSFSIGINKRLLFIEIFGCVVLMLGLWAEGTILNYIFEIRYSSDIKFLYWMLAAFLSFIAALIFLSEIPTASKERKKFDEQGETE